jgi:hypothetical protein
MRSCGEWLLASAIWVLLSNPALAQKNADSREAAAAMSRVEAMCPDALRESEELQSRMQRPHVPNHASRSALREDLLLMARQDQEARAFLLTGSAWPVDPEDPRVRWMNHVDSWNLKRLRHIVNQEGFPTAEMVGLDGVEAAWLMTIHAGRDPDFQQRVLTLTRGHVQRGEVPSDQVAMLTDDVLAGRGKPQRYGTNFEMRDGRLMPTHMEDETNIDAIRKSVGLGSLKNYACLMRAMYESPDPPSPAPVSSIR